MFQRPHRLFRIWLLTKPYVIVYGAREAEKVFTDQSLIDKSGEYAMMQPWLGLGLLTASGAAWRPRRKQLTPTFHYDILKDFMHTFNEQSRVMCRLLTPRSMALDSFDIYQWVLSVRCLNLTADPLPCARWTSYARRPWGGSCTRRHSRRMSTLRRCISELSRIASPHSAESLKSCIGVRSSRGYGRTFFINSSATGGRRLPR